MNQGVSRRPKDWTGPENAPTEVPENVVPENAPNFGPDNVVSENAETAGNVVANAGQV